MLTDYINVVPTLIAIVNTVIAVGVSHFRPERNRLKVTLLIVAIGLGILAAIATVYGQHLVIQKRDEEASRRRSIHAQLGEYISRGDQIMHSLQDQNTPVDALTINDWDDQIERYLASSFGAGYVARFRDGSGIFHGEPQGVDMLHVNVWNAMYERVVRLQQFSGELPP